MRIKRDDEKLQKPHVRRYIPREGRKVFAQVGFDRDEAPFGKGIEVGLVVIKDLELDDPNPDQPNDVGLLSTTKLWLNEKGAHYLWKFGEALQFGKDDPSAEFDAEYDDPAPDGTPGFAAVLGSNKGILIGEVLWSERKDRKTKQVVTRKDGSVVYDTEVRAYQPADLAALGLTVDGVLTDDVRAVIEAGETEYDESISKRAEKRAEWRANNPHPTGGGTRSAPTRPASTGGSSRPANPSPVNQGPPEDDIPF